MSTIYSPAGTSVTDYSSTQFLPGDIIDGSYSGIANPIKLPAGNYQLECWGAWGGMGFSGTVTASTSAIWDTMTSNYGRYFTVSEGTYTFTQNNGQWTANNLGVSSSTASITLTCSNATYFRILYYYNTESSFDKVTLTIGGNTILNDASGSGNGTTDSYYLSSGSTITVSYSKDSSVDVSNENVYFIIQYQYTNTTYTLNDDKSGAWGGIGGYSKGVLSLSSPTTLYLYVGGYGKYSSANTANTTNAGGFNGGGSSKIRWYNSAYSSGGGGGGASDIRIGTDSLYARVIVAGGGGGGAGDSGNYVKCGGGENGLSAAAEYQASQTKAGANGSFGQGANSNSSYGYNYGPGGGGGGWYGGGASATASDSSADYRTYNGGGSGYVYTSSTASNYPSGCLLNSSYYLTNASTVSKPTVSNPGNQNGYVRITVLSPLNIKIDSSTYAPIKAIYVKTDSTTWKGGDVTWLPTT